MAEPDVYIFSSSEISEKSNLSKNLLSKAKNGDSAAFGEIYDLFFQKIYRFIFYRVSHKETAEDLAEEVFLKAWPKLSSIRREEALEGWLYQIARNSVIDYYRQKKSAISLEEVENSLVYESSVIDRLDLSWEQARLGSLLARLKPDQQQIIKLKFFEQLDNSTIAALTGKSEGAIRVIQHRGIAKLQELLRVSRDKDEPQKEK